MGVSLKVMHKTMSKKKIAIAYCIENIKIADEIEKQLGRAKYQFDHFYCKRSTSEASLSDQLLNQTSPILLIISDNFLKSAQCMANGLRLLQEKGDRLLPIIVDGTDNDENTGEAIQVATNFERVSDIIQYINYWQDQYLDLRRQKRQLSDLDESKFSAHLKVMREISSEVGEYLRNLRNLNYARIEEFQANHYERFFRFASDQSGWESYKIAIASLPIDPVPTPSEPDPQPEPTQSSIAEVPVEPIIDLRQEDEPIPTPPIEDNSFMEPEQPTQDQEEEAPLVDLSDIPGYDILKDKEAEIEQPVELTDLLDQDDLSEPVQETPAQEEDPADSILHNLFDEEEEEGQAEEELPSIDNEEPMEPTEEPQVVQEPIPVAPSVAIQDTIRQGIELMENAQTDEAIALIQGAVEQNPESISLRYHLALFLAQQAGNIPHAIEQLDHVLDKDASNPDALYLRGELAEAQQDYQNAKTYFDRLASLKPDYPNIYYRLGLISAHHLENEKQIAIDYFKEAIGHDAENADAYYQYAALLSEYLKKPKKAVKFFKQALELQPHHPFANYDLAILYHQMDEYEKAKKAYLKATEINPEVHTEENDYAFGVKVKEEEPTVATASVGETAIQELREDIHRLELLLKAQETEKAPCHAAEEPPKRELKEVVLITGATAGIGKATARIFAEEGYRLILTGRRAERLEELKNELEENHHTEVETLVFDVRNIEAAQEALDKLEGPWRDIEILINNAGKAKGLAPIHEGELNHWEEMIDTNIKGLLYMTRLVAPGMVERRKGHIINVCSIAGKEVYPNGAVYCATKHAVDALTAGMRMDLFKHNIKVSQVSPAHVEETEFAAVRFDGDTERAKIYNDFNPLTSNDVGRSIYFITTQPDYVNIQDIVLSGNQQASAMLIDRSGRMNNDAE